MKRFIVKSFRMKVTLALVAALFLVAGLSNFLIYRFMAQFQLESLRDKLKIIAQTAALALDAETLMSVPLRKEGIETPQYRAIADKLSQIKKTNPPIRFIYTMTKTDQEGIWQFVVDPEPAALGGARGKNTTAYPGDRYDARRFHELLRAFDGPRADKKLEMDEWGVTLSGYAPIFDRNGQAVAVLGVDILAPEVFQMQREIDRRAFLVLALGLVFSLFVGMLVSRTISAPILALTQATRRLASGDLRFRLTPSGDDEIGSLATCFNVMAESLNESRARIHDYFYDVIQSLVRIVEARDRYTRGHSERVAEYVAAIAARMGFDSASIEMLKETALLHDIGKLGIQEDILNKKEKLTDQEWESIKKHPIIGEDILRPVAINPEMLAIVRGHHERYDGTGYPDHLVIGSITVFAQIIAVADAYDAMASSRAYRMAFSKGEALEELKRNKGTQFNPRIVDIFVEILQEGFVI